MKLIKKTLAVLLAIFASLPCIAFCACADGTENGITEKDITDNTSIRPYTSRLFLSSIEQYTDGVKFSYKFENATIEMQNVSEEAGIILDRWDKNNSWEEFDYWQYPYGDKEPSPYKWATYTDKVTYTGEPNFQWLPNQDWAYGVGDTDYVTFIARIENNIVGYAVIGFYRMCDITFGANGEVVINKEIPKINGKYQKVSEEAIREKIAKAIEENEKKKEAEEKEFGKLLPLHFAFKQGYLTHEQVLSIAYYQNSDKTLNPETQEEDYTPIPLSPTEPEKENVDMIVQAQINARYRGMDVDKTLITVSKYLGTYNGCVVVELNDPYGQDTGLYMRCYSTHHVSEVTIKYNNESLMLVWIKD